MTNAWSFFKKGIFKTFSEALKAAWAKWNVVTKLLDGRVSFTFRKANGEIREAIGTTNGQLFDYAATGNNYRKELPDVIPYFDLEKDSWRAFRIERLMSF